MPFCLPSLEKIHVALMRIHGELGRIMRFSKCPGSLINSSPSVVILCFPTSSFLWQSRSSCMMKRQGLVVTAWCLFEDHEPAFGFNGLPLVGVVFFPSS